MRVWKPAALPLLLTAMWMGGAGVAEAARVLQASPEGEVAVVRQVLLRFDRAVVDGGDPRAAAPFELRCDGGTPEGSARWLDERRWAFDLAEPLPAGRRCTLEARPGWAPRDGPLEGPSRFTFSTGAPAVLQATPWPGSTIDEAQTFVLRLNGAVDAASVARHARCEVEGLGERQGVRLVDGAERATVLRALGRRSEATPERLVLLACQRPLPPGVRVRLVWATGIAAAGDASLAVRREQRFEWTVRPRFLAEFGCERENAEAACLPLAPMRLSFSAPLPRALAQAVRLVPEGGGETRAPKIGEGDTVGAVEWPAPHPPETRYRLVLPATVVDDAGRPLANAGAFPLAVGTAPLPPLAKFAAAPFAVVEAPPAGAAEPAMLALTLRHVQRDLAASGGAVRAGGTLRRLHLPPSTADAALLAWIARLQRDHDRQWHSRAEPMLAGEAGTVPVPLPLGGDGLTGTQVVGVPLPARGLHVLEAESTLLGVALLDPPRPMHARALALVGNLGVHFKRGRSSSLVWVTTLDRARPVRGAAVVVNDCRGRALWRGTTDGDGLARIDRGFDEEFGFDGEGDDEGADNAKAGAPRCATRDGLFVTARARLAGQDELGFVFSRWQRGIEPWRFGIGTSDGTVPDRRAHTVFSRTLLRAGEPLHMKHFLRTETESGLARVPSGELPDQVWLTHLGSDTTTRLPLPAAAWAGGRSAESAWTVPKSAPLGLYEVMLVKSGAAGAEGASRAWRSGSFRVEAFRVPLVDARLDAPAVPVAPRELVFDARLAAMAGGPLAGQAVRLDALLEPVQPRFAAFDDFTFTPPRPAADDTEAGDGSAPRLVARELAAVTDRDGRARLVLGGLPTLTGPADLQAELGFSDLNGETQTVARRLRLWPSAVVAGIRLPHWASVRGPVGFTALALTTDGRPRGGQLLVVSARQQQVLSTRTRVVGGFYAYDNWRETHELGEVCRGSSDARGRLECRVDPARLQGRSGEIEFVVEARDAAGRSSRAAASAWIANDEPAWFAQDDDDRIELVPERREVEPGQRVRVQVRMPFARATALVTVEREGIVATRIVELTAQDPVFEISVPPAHDARAAAWSPNVVVSALLLRGRVRQAPWRSFFDWGWRDPADWWKALRHEDAEWRALTALVDLAKPSFRLGATELRVGRAAQRLDVAVMPERPRDGVRHRVRDTVPVRVRVARDGLGVKDAEIAFVAVDEGLLALAPNDSWQLLEGLLAPRPWGVSTATMQGEIVGRRHYGRKALPAGGGGGANPTRELFDTLLLWRGRVTPDASGFARIELPLNDSLTRFRLVAIADDGQGRFGTGEASLEVGQDLELASTLPRVVREGDVFDAVLNLRNTTAKPMALMVELSGKADGGGAVPLEPAGAQAVTLAPGAVLPLRWRSTVPEGTATLAWTAAATGRGVADRMAIEQRVEPVVPVRVWQSTLQPLGREPLQLPQSPPAGARPGSWQWQATLAPTLAASLPSVQDWFRRYAYTCLEQQTSRAIALADREAFARLGDELVGYLDSDGLAAFFPLPPGEAARGSDRLTAHLIAVAHEAGFAWPAALEQRMLAGLAAFVEGRLERRPQAPRADLDERKLAALAALARHGRAAPRQLGSIAWTPAVWPSSALLDAWTLLARLPAHAERDTRLAELQRLLRSRLVAGGTTLRFSTEADDERWWLLESADANAARLVLAAAADPAWRAELPTLMSGTLARQQRGAWRTTPANVWGALALKRFAAVVEAGAVGGQSVVGVGDQQLTLDWSANPAGGSLQLAAPVGAARATVAARHEGAGQPWLVLQTRAAVPLTAPLAAGYRLERTVEAVRQQRSGQWSRGDVLRVRLTVDAMQDLGWVVIADPVPAGARVLGSGLARDSAIATVGERRAGDAWPAYEERADDAWRAYFEWLPRGRHQIAYTLRLDAAGRFGLPPARVEAMYAPENFAERPVPPLEVRP